MTSLTNESCGIRSARVQGASLSPVQDASEREESVRALMEDKLSDSSAATRQLQTQLTHAAQQQRETEATLERMQRQKASEMEHVEQRVKAAIQRKDETIQALRTQLAEAHESMQATGDMLAAEP